MQPQANVGNHLESVKNNHCSTSYTLSQMEVIILRLLNFLNYEWLSTDNAQIMRKINIQWNTREINMYRLSNTF